MPSEPDKKRLTSLASGSSGGGFCPACGATVDDLDLGCAVCLWSQGGFPWDHVGETVVIGSGTGQPGVRFLRIECAVPDGSADHLGCSAGYKHDVEDFIHSCSEGVSQTHASITPESDGRFLVKNLSSTNATRVDLNNVPPEGTRAMVGQRVAVGQWDFPLGPKWPLTGFRRGTWRLPLKSLSVTAHGKPLLDDISLVAERSELMALLGPSGAGKTTLLYALARIKVAAGAEGADDDVARFWGSLGYVPQDDIIHGDLSVGQALRYACRLRLPAGTPPEKIEARVAWAIKQVGLDGKQDTRIGSAEEKTLSGGERRRVSLAVALVSNPQVLILDEPTSGLSWTDATRVVDCLKNLAENRNGPGRTIVVTIHQPDVREYDKFHQVAILAKNPRENTGARLVFFGPPGTSYPFFRAHAGRPPEIFEKIDGTTAPDVRGIAGAFQRSILHQTFVAQRLDKDLTSLAKKRGDPPRRPSPFHQLMVLLSRICALRAAKWKGLVVLLAVAAALGGLATLGKADIVHGAKKFGCAPYMHPLPADVCESSGDPAIWCMTPQNPKEVVSTEPSEQVPDVRGGLLSMLMAVFLPLLVVSSGTLVSERAIFRNESIAGVRAGPYLLARFIELFVIGTAFMMIVVVIALQGLGTEGSLVAYFETGIGVVAGAVSLGLFISALVPRPELALWVVNLIAIPQMIFSGAIARLTGGRELISHLTVTRPALEALVKVDLASRSNLVACQVERYIKNFPGYSPDVSNPVAGLVQALTPFTLICLLAAYVVLRGRLWRERRF
jgi:ABC-type multidrug transport system ATPase subunit